MASGETTKRKLKFPKPTDPPRISADVEELAKQLDNDVLVPVPYVEGTTLNYGELAINEKAPEVKIPTPAGKAGERVGVVFWGANFCTIKSAVNNIWGGGANRSSVVLTGQQMVVFVSDGTSWWMEGSQANPKWEGLAFGTNWENYELGGTPIFGHTEYSRDGFGIVRLRGLSKSKAEAKANEASGLVGTLPAGFRPGTRRIFSQVGSAGFIRIDITPTGEILPQTTATYVYQAWDGIEFQAEL
jgi:hypothetical protein